LPASADIKELHALLERKYHQYATSEFIESDPVQVVYWYQNKHDREIAGILSASFAWGKRSIILNKISELLDRMDHSPEAFVLEKGRRKYRALKGFVHRTFNEEDLQGLLQGLQNIYMNHGGLEKVFNSQLLDKPLAWSPWNGIQNFRNIMIGTPAFLPRTHKHISNPVALASCKRLHMFLRWMIRKDNVDTGLWANTFPASALRCPLDVHTGRVGRSLGILTRKQNDFAAVEELTQALVSFCPEDPIRYDLALFGLGVDPDKLL